ncbi:sialate O-acetylesterase [Puniceicoccus vermicola]|uniref:Sialate O-acetylesterase domain-containing protein n=1 Tax=Puniceicoccus vermicola TaxID=388746 RepID=A0A7X1AZ16_9BACT|nr:sialate O-acetylesterase [Puniceicoccus vermicola]MBC2602605.1 hypothetical protein [Puniceicoccus vermicola]
MKSIEMQILQPGWILFGLSLLSGLSANGERITRYGWDYDRADFRESEEEIALHRSEDKRIPLTGWADYAFEVPEAGWYELWFAGAPPEWNRDVFIDGETVSRLGFSSQEEDVDEASNQDRPFFKELNVYLTEGEHTLRYQRYSFPGYIPFVWELRPAEGRPESSVRMVVDGSRIAHPGDSIPVTLIGGNAFRETRYELWLEDQMTDGKIALGEMAFPVSDRPLRKEFLIELPEKVGLYHVLASVDGEMLRPSDLKGGYLMAAEDLGDPELPSSTKFAFAGLFSNAAVLQRGKELPIWGWSQPRENVRVTLAETTIETEADENGLWQVIFPPMEAGGPFDLEAESGGETIRSTGILVGEVWLLSGQSNMGGPILQSTGGTEVAREADYPEVRLGSVFGTEVDSGEKRIRVSWQDADSGGDPQMMKNWLAIHLAFGIRIHEELGIPVGLVRANRGGTYISTWSSMDLHRSLPSYEEFLEGHESMEQENVLEIIHLGKTAGKIRKWKARVEKAEEEGKPPPKEPKITVKMKRNNEPALHWDGLIEPMIPFAMRGVLWYQGESDSAMANAYRERFPAMIESWREAWGESEWPFYFVQVAYGKGALYEGEPGDFQGAEIKEMQRRTLSVPNTAMVVTDDLMTPEDGVHYHDKLPVGYRLALAALANAYGMDIEYSGPLYREMMIEDGQIRLYFDHSEGLQAKDGDLGGFAMAGADRQWVWANARVDGETVVVSHPDVLEPKAVRYSWAERPSGGNLVNQEGLPAAVFRTDDWPMVTEGVDWVQKH